MTERPILHLVKEFGPRADKLRVRSEAFRIAAEAYETATKYGCGGDALAALWAMVEREAKIAERQGASKS